MNKVTVRELIDDLKLKEIICPIGKAEKMFIEEKEINRPGIQLAGYFNYFTPERIQIIGKTEYTFFGHFDEAHREETLESFFSYNMPIIIVTRGMELREDFYNWAKKSGTIVCSTDRETTRFINKLSSYLEDRMAPKETLHGVLVDINGVGVFIRGESSIGKSETALDLVQNGNRLVADDAVEIKRIDDGILVGQAPELLRNYLEIRGIGIIDIQSLYGARSVNLSKRIDMVAYLESWDNNNYYDRLGLDRDYEYILGERIEKIVVPVKPGRNIAMVLEVAAMNYRQRQMGKDSAVEFTNRLNDVIKSK
ncbi:HPr(Ser) kinase/phosphatase [Peptostreptococcus canis]|uniref:HPr kinase/phosphorylase n=1 Tax=Peptostreptococcus canis TaxID=1159213 RepID=A0ABR6TKF5_9FIRM|nr:HPr(Ser) kinase/phosphatase [Peptostreptococcus canis]MBC2575486.1 HPr kinase/phosphorylase [Peptostreptococcus canis]MBP1997322.1 HPr kinase/phosphorylase [Peptostreptococcus canis]